MQVIGRRKAEKGRKQRAKAAGPIVPIRRRGPGRPKTAVLDDLHGAVVARPPDAAARCVAAYRAAVADAEKRGLMEFQVAQAGALAYRQALPLLSYDQLESYVAAVAHGVSLDAIPASEASRLLYAAQVMRSARAH